MKSVCHKFAYISLKANRFFSQPVATEGIQLCFGITLTSHSKRLYVGKLFSKLKLVTDNLFSKSLYLYSTEQPPTVTQQCTVAKLVLCQTIAEHPL